MVRVEFGIAREETEADMTSPEAVARYFLHLAAQSEEPSPVTHMQLQKLLYYAQGWSLAMVGQPLFVGRLEAWMHGPVVREVYPLFAAYDAAPIPPTEATDPAGLTPADRTLVQSVWKRYGRYSAWRLREMTHAEPPWMNARGSLPEGAASNTPLSEDSLRTYFGELHRSECAKIGLNAEKLARSLGDARERRTVSTHEAFGA